MKAHLDKAKSLGIKSILALRGGQLGTYLHTVKPVYNNHSRDQVMVVFVDRWSLYRSALESLRWSMEQPTVATIDRWSFYTRGS